MIATPGPRARGLIAAAAGATGALGLAPWFLWPLTILALAVAFALAARAVTARQAIMTGWAFGAGYFAVALSWIVEPFLVEPEIFGWMAPFALVFMAGGLALFFAAAFWGAHALGGWLVLTLAAAELARAYVLTGFPWAGFAQIWVGQGLDQSLAFIGPHGLGLATLTLGWAVRRGLDGPPGWPRRGAALGLIAAAALAGPVVRAALPVTSETGPVVRLVQPNAAQDQKWNPGMAEVFFARTLDLTAADPRPDLVVWPETAIPILLEDAEDALAAIAGAAGGVPVVTGIQRREGMRVYNSALVTVDGVVTQVYDKHHLVPFGEYIPFGDLAARFGLSGFATREGQGFSAGPGPQAIDLGTLGRALPLICYEAVFPNYARLPGSAARPALLLQITNDAWFGQVSGPYQHLAQARMRAIEQGLPMVRVANTGVSAMIDPWGRVTGAIALGTAGHLDRTLPRPRDATLYAATGDLPVATGVFLALAFLGVRRRPRNTD